MLAGEPILDALRKKFGAQAPALMQRVAGAGQGDGAAFANWAWRANTVKGGCSRRGALGSRGERRLPFAAAVRSFPLRTHSLR